MLHVDLFAVVVQIFSAAAKHMQLHIYLTMTFFCQ